MIELGPPINIAFPLSEIDVPYILVYIELILVQSYVLTENHPIYDPPFPDVTILFGLLRAIDNFLAIAPVLVGNIDPLK